MPLFLLLVLQRVFNLSIKKDTSMNPKMVIGAIIFVVIISIIGMIILSPDSETESLPVTPTIPTIGVLAPIDTAAALLIPPMEELGYIEGDNIQYHIELIPTTEDYEAAIQALIDAKVDVIVSTGAPAAVTASKLTTTIPIVFMGNQGQFISELEPLIRERAGNTNLTGVITTNPAQRRFELLMDTDPTIKVVYVPYDSSNTLSVETLKLMENAASEYDVTIIPYEFTNDADAQQALENIPEDADAIIVGSEVGILARIMQWSEVSITRQVPLVVALGQFTGGGFPPGILLGYGGGVEGLYQQVADLVDQILQGTSPADLPIRPSDVYLTVSLGAAEALGIEIPLTVLDQATQIIREEVVLPSSMDATESANPACSATLTTPIGKTEVCITQTCGQLQDNGFATYSDKVETVACTTENLLGICVTDTVSTYLYRGEVDAAILESGCATSGGLWQASAE